MPKDSFSNSGDMRLRSFATVASWVLTASAHAVDAGNVGFDWRSIEYVYAFGDSYTFVQGTRGHANFRLAASRSVQADVAD